MATEHEQRINRILSRHAKECDKLRLIQEQLQSENEQLKTVMMAAAVEIAEHWKDHCDKDGYGPVNLLRRLQKGLTDGGYAYTADDWIRLRAQNAKLVENNNELIDFAIWMTGCGYDFCQHKYFCEQRDKLLKGQALSHPDLAEYVEGK